MSATSLSFSTHRRQLLLGAVSLVLLAGCGGDILGPGKAPQLYLLRPEFGPVDGPAVPWALDVETPGAADMLNTSRIALFNPPARMDYYANASWPDQLPDLIQSALVQAFERSGRIAAVAPDSAGLRSDYMLETEIRDFNAVYDVPDTAPKVKIRIMAKLVRSRGRSIVQSREFSAQTDAGANSVDNVVIAASQGLSEVLKEIVAWTLKAPPIPASDS
jgi:cholesterol transport system auxiliary component